ncbi:XRE family transcriptional regulator [Lactococcus lactis]|uniref:LexA family transcriptional regulator n=1 Tax=Lactococcus lactis TaxID=1358 RepID=UPI002418A432|nr:XRE family transcriptional regulator [Lactococcus lactis]MDG4966300.1 XRE family transcriptional regulator [Lactococcus lactis]
MKKIQLPEMIDYFRKEKGWTMKELGLRMGKAESTVSLWISGKRSPMVDDFDRLVTLFGTDSDTLMYGGTSASGLISETIDTMKKLKEQRQEKVLLYSKKQLTEQQNENIVQLNEFTYTYFDNPLSAGTGEHLTDGAQETITLPVDYAADFVAPVTGDSMEPMYYNGDYAFVETTYNLSDGDTGVFNLDGDAYIKQLLIDQEGAFLHSINPKYRDKPILPESDFRIIGKVIGRYNENDKEN